MVLLLLLLQLPRYVVHCLSSTVLSVAGALGHNAAAAAGCRWTQLWQLSKGPLRLAVLMSSWLLTAARTLLFMAAVV